jgi:hypothetical protein
MTLFLPLTRSQQMALIEVLMAYVRMAEPQSFVDASTDTTTTAGELLTLVGAAYAPPTVSLQMALDSKLNGFALQLLSESLAGKKDIHTFRPLRFEFRGVIYTLEPAKTPEPTPEVIP